MNYLQIPATLYEDSFEILAYIGLQLQTIDSRSNPALVTPDTLFYGLFGTWDVPQYTRKHVLSATSSLIDKGIVQGRKVDRFHYLIDGESFTCKQYGIITYEEMRTIVDTGNFDLLRYFTIVMRSKHGATKVVANGESKRNVIGFQRIAYFADEMNVSYRTILRYNEELESMKLLYIRRNSHLTKMPDGDVIREPNIYGRYEDKDFVDAYADYMQYTQDKEKHLSRRSLAQKYKKLLKGAVYNDDIMAEIKWYAETCKPPKRFP